MSRLKFVALIVVVVTAIVAVRVVFELIDLTKVLGIPSDVVKILREFRILDVVLTLIIGIVLIQSLASFTYSLLKQHGRSALLVRNVVLIMGYIALSFAIGTILGLGREGILASATFSGLIIGLALQPVLSNFFSGLIILTTGYVKPGQEIKLAGIPLAFISLPAYKFFSRDIHIPNIRGTVVEVGFLYTKILDTDGNLLKVSNNMLLSNSVVMVETEEERRIQVRYEFPVTCDPDVVFTELQNVFDKMLRDYKLFIEEQSEKKYYIVLLTTITPPKTSGRIYRSNILKEMIKVHRRLVIENKCVE